jgi:hypothetical protein
VTVVPEIVQILDVDELKDTGSPELDVASTEKELVWVDPEEGELKVIT